MSRGGLVMMVVILALVWGGFAGALTAAILRERRRGEAAGESAASGAGDGTAETSDKRGGPGVANGNR